MTAIAGIKAVGTAISGAMAGTLGTVATIGSGVLSAYSMQQQGKAAAAAAGQQAAEQEREALQTMEAADRDDLLMRKQFAQQQGGNRVALAAAGVDVNSAQALELLGENTREFEQDALVIRTNASRQANTMGRAAMATRQEGANARSAANWGSFGTILGTATKVGDRYKKYVGQRAYQNAMEA